MRRAAPPLVILTLIATLLAAGCKRRHTVDRGSWALVATEIPGGPHDVDPIAVVPVAATQVKELLDAKDAELLSIRMVGVGRTGRMDLGGCDGSINYRFGVHDERGRSAAAVTVGARGMYRPIFEPTSNITNGGLAVPAPHCRVETVRAAAVLAGAADEACALQLEYTRVADPEIGWFHGLGWRTFGPAGPIVIDDATCAVVPRQASAGPARP